MQNTDSSIVVILGTGGTIAGTAEDAGDDIGYTAAQLGVAQLVMGVPALGEWALECEQVAQIDSKDMDHTLWRTLARRCAAHLQRAEVAGVVIAHGTDTLEETAWFLQRVLAPNKPVVLTGAMRPATALHSDGPQNLLDSVIAARHPGAHGVVAVMAGVVHGARDVRKLHPYRLDAFGCGDAGAIGRIEQGQLRIFRSWPNDEAIGAAALAADVARWPRVEIVTSHAGATGGFVRALCVDGVHGIVVAGTGNGSVHRELDEALAQARSLGVTVLRSTRCVDGHVIATPADLWPAAGDLTPPKARVELMLRLMAENEQRACKT